MAMIPAGAAVMESTFMGQNSPERKLSSGKEKIDNKINYISMLFNNAACDIIVWLIAS